MDTDRKNNVKTDSTSTRITIDAIKKIFNLWKLFIICLFLCTGCATSTIESGEQTTSTSTTIEKTFVITEKTSIEEDFEYFNLEMKPGYDSLALTKICSMINDGDTFYLYLNMPEDTEHTEYRVKNIKMNDISYIPKLVQVDGYYQKYVLYHCAISSDQRYVITEIRYDNNKDLTDGYTHYQNQTCYMETKDQVYRFRLEYENEVLLQGKLFECIYQFNKENGTFMDLWYKVTDNSEKLDEDKRSFFYFAFNCYDKEREVPFTPEDILQVDVKYNELRYSYQGKDKSEIGRIEPEITLEKEESITPDEVTVTAKESNRSNGFFYHYQTINRLDEADLEQNISDERNAVLQMAASNYDWAISVGDKEGYRYATNDTWFSHDYEYTEIEEFRTIHVIYTFEGTTYSVNTDSLIGEKVVTLPVIVPEVPESKSIFEKIFGSIQQTFGNTQEWIFEVAAVMILVLVVLMIGKRILRKRR